MAFYADIETVVSQAVLSERTSKEILAVLNDPSWNIPLYKALRLLKLLNSLKAGHFPTLGVPKKKEFLQTLTEMSKQNQMSVSRICHLFFGHAPPQKGIKNLFPDEMEMKLINAGRMERVESVKILVWDLLRTQGGLLARLVSPEDLVFIIWLDAPLMRNKFILFMFRHFDSEKVMAAVCKYASETGKRIPSSIVRQFIALARSEARLTHRCRFLANIITRSDVTHNQMEAIWADYLQGRNRFELIQIFLSKSDTLGCIDDLARGCGQLSFDLNPKEKGPNVKESFASRVYAIRSNKQGSFKIKLEMDPNRQS